jgi:hypothetical protein
MDYGLAPALCALDTPYFPIRYHIDFAETPCTVTGNGDDGHGGHEDSVMMELTERSHHHTDTISAPRYGAALPCLMCWYVSPPPLPLSLEG